MKLSLRFMVIFPSSPICSFSCESMLTYAPNIDDAMDSKANSKQDEKSDQLEALRIFRDVLHMPEMMNNSGRVLKHKWVQDGKLLAILKAPKSMGSFLKKRRSAAGGKGNLEPKPRHVYLFTDLLVISNPNSDTVAVLPLKDLCVLTNDKIFAPAWDGINQGTSVLSAPDSEGSTHLRTECIECWHLEPLARAEEPDGVFKTEVKLQKAGNPSPEEQQALTNAAEMKAGFMGGVNPGGILPPKLADGAIVVAARGKGVFILHADNVRQKEEFVGVVLSNAAHDWAVGGGAAGGGAAGGGAVGPVSHEHDPIVKSIVLLGQCIAENTEKMHLDGGQDAFLDNSDSSVEKFMAAAAALGHPMAKEDAKRFIEDRGTGKDMQEVLGYLTNPRKRMGSIKARPRANAVSPATKTLPSNSWGTVQPSAANAGVRPQRVDSLTSSV